MKKTILYLVVLSLTVVLVAACGALQEPAQPSAPLEAIPLQLDTQPEATAVPAEASAQAEAYPAAEVAAEPAQAPETAVAAYPAGDAAAAPAASNAYPVEETAAPAADGRQIYAIDPAGSEVRFTLDEDLRGIRTTVIGITDQVAGELALDLSDLSTAQVGAILINARTLVTDNNFRNQAIQNQILDTRTYEFITFTPTAVTGLPASVASGETVTFNIEGDLTIRAITQPVVFVVTATAVSQTQISGTATATVSRADYDLRIPSVPSVANVDDAVVLTIEFTANAN